MGNFFCESHTVIPIKANRIIPQQAVLESLTTEGGNTALNKEGIAVRSGHHCAQPILRRFGLESTVRPSLAFYNTFEEIDCLAATVWNLKNGRSSGLV